MQINEAMFLQNGKCGYVLRPKFHFDPNFDPSNRKSYSPRATRYIHLRVS